MEDPTGTIEHGAGEKRMLMPSEPTLVRMPARLADAAVPPLLLVEMVLGTLASLGSVLALAGLAHETVERDVQPFDTGLTQAVFALRAPWLTAAMLKITFFGGPVLVLLTGLALILLALTRHWREAWLVLAVSVMGVVVNLSLKNLIQRPRPTLAPLATVDGYSFPSGHALNALVFYALLAYLGLRFSPHRWQRVAVVALAAALTLLIGISRVYLGVHYPSDVAAGFVAGFWLCVTAFLMARTLALRRLVREAPR